MKLRRLDRRDVVIFFFIVMAVMNVVSCVVLFLRPTPPEGLSLVILLARTAIFLVLMVLYLRGWDPARHVFAILVTAFSIIALMDSLAARRLPIGLLVPILMTALVSDWRGILASGLVVTAAVFVRVGPAALLASPETLLVFLFCLLSVMVLWIIFDNARRSAIEASEELGRSVSRLRFTAMLLDRVGQSVIAGDFENRLTFANEEARRLHGWIGQDVLGKGVPETMIDLGPGQLEESGKALREGRTFNVESIGHDHAGHSFPVFMTVSPVRNEDGAITGWVSVSVDLSRLKAAERALAESEQRYRTLVSNLPVIVFAVDREGRYTLSDGAALDLVGRKPGEVVGRSMLEFYRDNPKIQADLRAALSGIPVRSEAELFGHVFVVAYDPVLDADGKVRGVTGVAMDQTERRRAEAEVLKLNRELEARVAERTSQLNEANASLLGALEDLRSAQARLVLSEKVAALGQLVASIAHQLNTPLGAISSSATVMIRELSSGLLPFAEGYAALGQAERRLMAELFGTASKKGPLFDPREERQRRKGIAAILRNAGVSEAESLAADLAPIADEELSMRLLPLAGTTGGGELVNSFQAVVTALGAGRIIENAVEKASHLIRILRLYSSQGQHEEALRIDLREELGAILAAYRAKYGPGIRVEASFDGDCQVSGRPEELGQLWINLMDNACQAMEYNGLLSVTARASDGRVVVAVSDTGPGIPERHGGGIGFSSVPGRTVFTVDLPASQQS